jgi:hypothetical protein
MIFFVVQVLILVEVTMDTEKAWVEMDKTARDPLFMEEWDRQAESYYGDQEAKRRQLLQGPREVTSLLPFMRDHKAQKREDQILFKAR